MSTSQPAVTLKPSSEFRFDKRRDGWKLVVNTPIEGEEPTLTLTAEFLKKDRSVKGSVMLERSNAMKKGKNAGQLHAERLLEQQNTIPKEWRDYKLEFAGTVWRDPLGDLYVPRIVWRRNEWDLDFKGLEDRKSVV